MNDNKRKLYARIEKLLRLAGDNRTNAHEANLARNIALNLLRKKRHHIKYRRKRSHRKRTYIAPKVGIKPNKIPETCRVMPCVG